MQNKTILYVVGGLVVIGIIVGVAMKKPSGSESVSSTGVKNQESSLKDLLSSGGSQKCTFTQKAEGAETSGEVYVAGGKMRGDFASMMNGQNVKSHMIVQSGTSYVWTDMMKQGFKISFDQMEAAKAQGKTNSQSVDINQRFNYDCNPWGGDNGTFSLPGDITFSDMGALMQTGIKANAGTNTGNSSGNSAQCGACEQIPDASSKQQCKAALGCK